MALSSSQALLLPLLCLLELLAVAAAANHQQEQPTPASPPITLHPGCPDKCGNVSIPYPFGTKDGCFRPGFFVICNDTFHPPRPFLNFSQNFTYGFREGAGRIEVRDLYYMIPNRTETTPKVSYWPIELAGVSPSDGKVRLLGTFCYECSLNKTYFSVRRQWINLEYESRFVLSDTDNVLMGIGNNVIAEQTYGPLCQSYVLNSEGVVNGSCSGQGCCQANLPRVLQGTGVDIQKHPNPNNFWYLDGGGSVHCSYAMIVEKTWYNFSSADLDNDAFLRRNGVGEGVIPFVVDFTIDIGTCPEAGKPKPKDLACISDHSECVDRQVQNNGTRYYCRCSAGYEGNPYIEGGCQGVVVGLFIIALLVFIILIRNEKRKMADFFKKNGGPILEKAKIIKIYKKEELNPILKRSNFIGRGAFGEVYKGFLDNQLVAVKKPIEVMKPADGNDVQNNQFANEVIIQSQVIHKNIVKLIGCCLEVDKPMLVYEFLPKGSLDDILHGSNRTSITLECRLSIAAESAEGLAYLHSKTTNVILHGDVKPANILLDDSFTPKISDFGISRLIVIDKEHTDFIIGDRTYMDPVYL